VLKIAELLNSDKAIKARLAELKKATKDARAEIVASGRSVSLSIRRKLTLKLSTINIRSRWRAS
jgi:ABC-type Fe3+-citrate transport system substrate-binding protein